MKNISEVLTGVKTMGIAGHIRPDGDCVGSCMALYLYVTEHFPEIDVRIYLDHPKPCLLYTSVHHDRYERGIPAIELEDGLLPKLGRTRETGTCVNFLPDPEIFEKTRFSATEVKSRLHETAYLNPEPVSYTHLDVYKRQVLRMISAKRKNI